MLDRVCASGHLVETLMNLIIMPVVAGLSMTRDCVKSLLAQDIGEVRVLAIDNGSQDGVGSYLRTLPSRQVTLLTKHHRVGLNALWNECLTMAFDSLKLDEALVVNNDTVLHPCTFRLLRDDGGLFVTAVGQAPGRELEIGDLTKRRPHPDFSCFLITRECWEGVGPFDERIHAFFGDNDYHIRMHRAGIEAYSLPIPFTHIASGTMKLASNELRDAIQREADEDREMFRRKYGFLPATPEYSEEFMR